jgi:hypothetical protein
MLRLTRRLFEFRPEAHYADFHERALFNHILDSIDPEDGRTCYMVPVGRGVRHEYQDMFRSFTCCVGSGMESHALHGDGIYYESGDKLYVNLYAPSTADWVAAGAKLAVETDFPEGESATITLTVPSPREFTLGLRRPYWVGEGFAVKVNGEAVEHRQDADATQRRGPRRGAGQALPQPSSYVEIQRTWKTGDRVEIALPKTLRLEPVPDNPQRVAILWGPLVLAGDLGPEPERGRGRGPRVEEPTVPVFVAAERPVEEWLKPVARGEFRTDRVGRLTGSDEIADVNFVPFYRLHRRTYAVYWDLFTPDGWEQERAKYAAEQERLRRLQAATVAYAQPGEMQPERDFSYQAGDGVSVQRVLGRTGRRGNTWFSFEMPVESEHPMALVATYYSDERRRGEADFEILVDGQRLAQQKVERSSPARFFDVEYVLPANMVQNKEKVTVRFQATEGNEIATVFGLRMIRADAER